MIIFSHPLFIYTLNIPLFDQPFWGRQSWSDLVLSCGYQSVETAWCNHRESPAVTSSGRDWLIPRASRSCIPLGGPRLIAWRLKRLLEGTLTVPEEFLCLLGMFRLHPAPGPTWKRLSAIDLLASPVWLTNHYLYIYWNELKIVPVFFLSMS